MVNAFLPALFLMTEAAFPVGAVYKMNPLDSCWDLSGPSTMKNLQSYNDSTKKLDCFINKNNLLHF